MMKTIDDYLEILGLSTNSSLDEILAKAEEYKAVTTNEINGIKTISVMPLPNVVQNKSTELKQRMTNIVSDDSKGAVAIVNIRFALVYLLMQKVGQIQTDLDNDEDAIEQLEELLNQRVKIAVQKDGSSSSITNSGDKIELNVNSSSVLLVNSTEIKQTANYVALKATDGTNTNTLAITPQSVNINGKDVVVEDDLTAETTARQNADTNLQNQITQLGLDLDAEEDARTLADTSLQSQIDAINAAQNLADIVADLTALNNYDTSVLEANDKVEVLSDSNHDYSATVYNWTGSAWQYIGKYGDSYSKAESDAKYVDLTSSQTISGSKTFTNTTFWAIEDSSNHRGQVNVRADYLDITYYKDSSLDNYVQKTTNSTNLYDKCYIVDYTNGTETRIEQYANYIQTRVEDRNNSNIYSYEKIEKNKIDIYAGFGNGYSRQILDNTGVYGMYNKTTSNENYTCYGGIFNYPYFKFEGTSTSAGNPYDVNGIFQLNYNGFWAYIEDNDTDNYGSLRVSKNWITLKVGNDDDSTNDKELELSMANGLTLNGNKIIDTANASTELFMTDAEMDTLISEVFN